MDSNQVFKSKVVLITGGTGSFGKTFARRLLQEDQVQKVIIFSRDELKQWEMKDSEEIFNHPKIRYFLGDVRDKERLIRSFSDVDYVIHAAALKQVPAAEYNPTEFIKTNVQGAINIIDAAITQGVEKVVALSSDKAVNPVNLYGATKLCSDKLFVAAESYVGQRSYPIFSVVRYGNVVGSRGSVLPYWKKLIKNGAKTLPVTDPRMTRFWITLDQSVDLVVKALKQSRGSEIFVPKIPSIKMTDLAEALLPGASPEIIGIRPGEKLHELMISSDDARRTLEFDDHFLIYPEKYSQDSKKGKPLKEGFSYTSDNNPEWLSLEQLQSYLGA